MFVQLDGAWRYLYSQIRLRILTRTSCNYNGELCKQMIVDKMNTD
ncbi:unnamed protein product [Amoebophrya sp. A25]|nr:unnamed protein product [Amoebophrya sp. A25]|eukprot:GSA25T00012208001.1